MRELTLNSLLNSEEKLKNDNLFFRGNTYRNYSTIMVIATRDWTEKRVVCPHCEKSYMEKFKAGIHPWVVESWKQFIKPMNVPVIDMVIAGCEVGDAYEKAVDMILGNSQFDNFKHILFLEDDILVPFVPNSYGPLIELYQHMDDFDVASALYFTKGECGLPLVYGNGDMSVSNKFEVNTNWIPGQIVEVNGCGMGFALMKRSIFEDKRLERPFFKTLNEAGNNGPILYTQDLYFYEKIKKLGYRICVDTRIRCGHLDVQSEKVY